MSADIVIYNPPTQFPPGPTLESLHASWACSWRSSHALHCHSICQLLPRHIAPLQTCNSSHQLRCHHDPSPTSIALRALQPQVLQMRQGVNMRVNLKERGDCFGEVSLMYSCPRNATVAATTDAVVWVLERDVFRWGA